MSESLKKQCTATPDMSLLHPCEQELLLRITTCLAQNDYHTEVGVMVKLSKAFWNDEQIWDAFKDVPGKRGFTRLMYAATKADVGRATFLLNRGAKVGSSVNGKTALNLGSLPEVCLAKNLALVRLLVARGADVNAIDESGLTPLSRAAMFLPRSMGMVFTLKTLGGDLEMGALRLTMGDEEEEVGTPFTSAMNFGQWEAARELAFLGANVDALVGTPGSHANSLTRAIQTGWPKAVNELLEMGADPNFGFAGCRIPPLHLAVMNMDNGEAVPGTHLTIFKDLLAHGADVFKTLAGRDVETMIDEDYGGDTLFMAALDAHFLLHPRPTGAEVAASPASPAT